MLGIILVIVFVLLMGFMAFEAYILSPKRLQDANRILHDINTTKSEHVREEMRKSYDEIIEYEQNTTFIVIILFMLDMIVNLIYIIIYKPFD